MKRKIIASVLSVLILIVSLVPAYATSETDNESIEIVEKDMQTNIVEKKLYFGDEVEIIDSWEDNAPIGSVSIPDFSNPSIETQSIIDDDGRTLVSNTQQFPYSAIVHLEIHFGLITKLGTGFLVDDNIVVTAGHCLYDRELGWATLITVRPGRDGSLSIPYGLATSKRLSVATSWYEHYDTNYDWGAIALNVGLIGNPGHFIMRSVDNIDLPMTATICGYPGQMGSSIFNNYKQYEMSGEIHAYNDYRYIYTIDTSGGQSGAPILNSNNEVIGIHTTGSSVYNYGIRITPNVLYYLNNFIAEYT